MTSFRLAVNVFWANESNHKTKFQISHNLLNVHSKLHFYRLIRLNICRYHNSDVKADKLNQVTMYDPCSFLNVTLVWLPMGPPFTVVFASKKTGSAPVNLHISGRSLCTNELVQLNVISRFESQTCTWISRQTVSVWIVDDFLISLQHQRFPSNLRFDRHV